MIPSNVPALQLLIIGSVRAVIHPHLAAFCPKAAVSFHLAANILSALLLYEEGAVGHHHSSSFSYSYYYNFKAILFFLTRNLSLSILKKIDLCILCNATRICIKCLA